MKFLVNRRVISRMYTDVGEVIESVYGTSHIRSLYNDKEMFKRAQMQMAYSKEYRITEVDKEPVEGTLAHYMRKVAPIRQYTEIRSSAIRAVEVI